MTDLENRIHKLEQAFAAFSQEIRLAYHYIQPDAASSLTKSRIVMEKILISVYKAEMGKEPRKPLLGEILLDNQFTRKIDRRILSRMNAIRDMSNLGPHGEQVQPNDAERVLDDLCTVLDWCLTRAAPPVAVPPPADGPAPAAAAPPGRPPRRARWRTFLLVGLPVLAVLAVTAALARYMLVPRKAASGKFGGIEIGSKGIKMFAGDFFPGGNSWDYTLLAQDSDNPDLGRHLNAAGTAFDEKTFNESMDIVGRFFKALRDEHGIPPGRIFVFCTAGLFDDFKDDAARIDNEHSLTVGVKKATGRVLDIISKQDKAKYDFMGFSPPPDERVQTLVIHVGSNTTEGTCEATPSTFQTMSVEYGYAKYAARVAKEVRPQETFDQAAERLAATEVVPRIKEGIDKSPLLNQRPKVYVAGAIVWALARYMHPEAFREKRVGVTALDVESFRKRVVTISPARMTEMALDKVDDEDKEALRAELEQIQAIFKIPDPSRPSEVWIAGAELLTRLSQEYDFVNKDPEFWTDSEYACTIGYIVKKAGIER